MLILAGFMKQIALALAAAFLVSCEDADEGAATLRTVVDTVGGIPSPGRLRSFGYTRSAAEGSTRL